jgi:hypothetical protein
MLNEMAPNSDQTRSFTGPVDQLHPDLACIAAGPVTRTHALWEVKEGDVHEILISYLPSHCLTLVSSTHTSTVLSPFMAPRCTFHLHRLASAPRILSLKSFYPLPASHRWNTFVLGIRMLVPLADGHRYNLTAHLVLNTLENILLFVPMLGPIRSIG